MYQIKNDVDFEAFLILMDIVYYPYATPEARARYDNMTEDEKNFYKNHLTNAFQSDIIMEKGEEKQ